jgi:hypothetical protein
LPAVTAHRRCSASAGGGACRDTHLLRQGREGAFRRARKNKPAIEKLIRSIKGLASYALIRTHEGGVSVTVAQDKAGTDESVKLAREWIAANVPDSAAVPKVAEGSTMVHIKT